MDRKNWENIKETFGINTGTGTSSSSRAQHSRHNTTTPRRKSNQSQLSQFMKPTLAISVQKVEGVYSGESQVKGKLHAPQESQPTEDDWKWFGEDNAEYLTELVNVTSQYDTADLLLPVNEIQYSVKSSELNKPCTTTSEQIIPSSPDIDDEEIKTLNVTSDQRKRPSQTQLYEANSHALLDRSPRAKHSRIETNLHNLKINTTDSSNKYLVMKHGSSSTNTPEGQFDGKSKPQPTSPLKKQEPRITPKPKVTLEMKQQRKDLKKIKDTDLSNYFYATPQDVIRKLDNTDFSPGHAQTSCSKEVFANVVKASENSQNYNTCYSDDLGLYSDLASVLLHGTPVSPAQMLIYVTKLVDLCERLLSESISSLLAPRLQSKKEYSSATLHKWWISLSLHDPEPWCMMELFPLLRRSLAVLVEVCNLDKEMLLKVLELGILKKQKMKQETEESEEDARAKLKETSSSEGDAVLSSYESDDESSSDSCSSELVCSYFFSASENDYIDSPESRYEYAPAIKHNTVYLIQLLAKLVDVAVTHPEAHLLEGSICAVLDVLAAVASQKYFMAGSTDTMMWTLCRSSQLKMTPSIIKRLVTTACALTIHCPMKTGWLCMRSLNKNPHDPCFVKRLCFMLQEMMDGKKTQVCDADVLLGKTKSSYFLQSEFYHFDVGTPPEAYLKQLIESILKWMHSLHAVPSHYAQWYAPLYKNQHCCSCFKILFQSVMKQVFKWFYNNSYKMEGNGKVERKALHVLYKVKNKLSNTFKDVAQDLYLDVYQFASMMLRENKTSLTKAEIEFAESVESTNPSCTYCHVLPSFCDVLAESFQCPAVPVWAGPYPSLSDSAPISALAHTSSS